jgi:hypothetical protein
MSKDPSLGEMLADLERRVAFHRQQEALHLQQESHHREERTRHAAALEQAAQQLDTLKAAASGAQALLREAAPLPDTPPRQDVETEAPRLLSRMVALVVRDWTEEGPFAAAAVSAELNRRFGRRLKKPATVVTVRKYLLRLSQRGVIRAVRTGLPYAESLFETIPRK